jgi:hypothetical protein
MASKRETLVLFHYCNLNIYVYGCGAVCRTSGNKHLKLFHGFEAIFFLNIKSQRSIHHLNLFPEWWLC